ncbi:MAG: hypothetical protein JWO68_719 [Actinomycetia bacterium]|nr:hypothetical protein [Actinomycetes bacterium]
MPVDLLLSDDPPPRRRRPRWVDGLGLTAVVGGMLAVGLLGDRGPRDAPEPTTTTSTTADRPAPAPAPTTTSTTAGPTFVTKRLQEETDTTLLLLDDARQAIRLLDVDTGLLRPVLLPPGYTTIGTGEGFLVASPGRVWLVRIGGAGDEIVHGTTDEEHTLVAAGLAHAWFTSPSGVREKIEELGADGTRTGRAITLPGQSYVAAGLDEGVVVSQGGSLTYVPVRGRLRALGHGEVLGGGGHVIVRSSCEALRCHLDVVDTANGRSRPVTGVPEPQATLGGGGVLSGDGRWLAVTVYDADTGVATLVGIDLTTGRGRVLNRGTAIAKAFAVTGPTLFTIDRGRLRAYDVTTGANREFSDVEATDVTQLVATVRR